MFFRPETHAGSIEFANWLPWKFLEAEMRDLPVSFQMRQDHLVIQFDELRPILKNLQLKVQGVSQITGLSAQGFRAKAEDLQVDLSVNEIEIDQNLERNFSGQVIRIRLRAFCDPIQLRVENLRAQAFAGFGQNNSSWEPVLKQLNLDLSPSRWQVSQVNCRGLQGLEVEIKKSIHRLFSDPKFLQELILPYLADQLQLQWRTQWSDLKNSLRDRVEEISVSEPQEQGFVIRGKLRNQFPGYRALPDLKDFQFSATDPQLVISRSGLEGLVAARIRELSLTDFNLQSLPAFQKLMRSRFLKMFLWPDLLRFKKSQAFYLSTLPETQSFHLTPTSHLGLGLRLSQQGILQADRQGLRTLQHWNLDISGQLKFAVSQGRLQVKLTEAQSNLKVKFDSDYIQRFNPQRWISRSLLKSAGKLLFENRPIEEELPKMQWSGKVWSLSDLRNQSGVVVLKWQQDPPLP